MNPRRLTSLCASAATAVVLAVCPPAGAATLQTVATHLDQPKKLTLTASGDLLVALSGDGRAPKSCTDGDQRSCLDHSGAIDEVTPAGQVTALRSGLPSIAESHSDPQATGPIEAMSDGSGLDVLFQNTINDTRTGDEIYGRGGALLDTFDVFGSPAGDLAATLSAALGRYEARHDPDHGAGTDVRYGEDRAIDSDPYSFVAWRDGWAVADAGANDVVYVTRTGAVRLIAVLPTLRERAAAGTYGKAQRHAIWAEAQSVPTGIAVGPDGALYVGELGGVPYARGASNVYRIVPGDQPVVYARGFTAIGDIGFDSAGRLLVLELDRRGLDDPGLDRGRPASGALYAVSDGGRRRTLLVGSGLRLPTGLAAAADGVVYLSVRGLSSADDGQGGEIVRVTEG